MNNPVPSFFIIILSSQRVGISKEFMLQMRRSFANTTVILRDNFKNLWPVDVARDEDQDAWIFDKGWTQFFRGNSLELGEFMVFKYKGNNLFNFKLFGLDGCEKKQIKVEQEEMEYEHEGLEMEEDDDKEDGKEDDANYVKQEEDDEGEDQDDDDDDEYVEEDDQEKINKRNTNGTGGRYKTAACYGFDIFDSGLAVPPQENAFFVSRSRPRKNELYIPKEVVVDYNLEIPEVLFVVDEQGNKWASMVKEWKDRRLWCDWKCLVKANQIKKNDVCVCELLKKEGSNVVHSIVVHVVPGL